MSAAGASGAALDAAAVTEDDVPQRTPAQQEYLDTVADDAEKAVDTVQQMIDDWTESLAGRKAEAERARAEAENGRV